MRTNIKIVLAIAYLALISCAGHAAMSGEGGETTPRQYVDDAADTADERPETIPDGSTRVDARHLRRWARLRGWKLPITDGPFAESKEMLGG